jgi:hypothetical protein
VYDDDDDEEGIIRLVKCVETSVKAVTGKHFKNRK